MKTDKEKHFFDQIWKFWCPEGAEVPPCLICYKEAVTLHEINPRSTNPEWLDQPFNSIPICNNCHEEAQIDPTSSAIHLSKLAITRTQNIIDWKGQNYNRVIREIYPENEKK